MGIENQKIQDKFGVTLDETTQRNILEFKSIVKIKHCHLNRRKTHKKNQIKSIHCQLCQWQIIRGNKKGYTNQ